MIMKAESREETDLLQKRLKVKESCPHASNLHPSLNLLSVSIVASLPTGVFMIWDGHHSKEMFPRDALCYYRATGEGQDQFYVDVMTVSCR